MKVHQNAECKHTNNNILASKTAEDILFQSMRIFFMSTKSWPLFTGICSQYFTIWFATEGQGSFNHLYKKNVSWGILSSITGTTSKLHEKASPNGRSQRKGFNERPTVTIVINCKSKTMVLLLEVSFFFQKKINKWRTNNFTSCRIKQKENTSTFVSYSSLLRTSGAMYLPIQGNEK